MKKSTAAFFCLVMVGGLIAPATASSSTTLFVLDASGSMWGEIEGGHKIVIARDVFGKLVDDLPGDAEVGLIAYGHRREGDCSDIETLVPIGPLDMQQLKETVNGLNPKGKTPITASIQQAVDLLRDREGGAAVILVSDGLETCGGDPCAAVRLAKDEGLDFVLHVVGFDVAGEDVSQLECAAQAGGGLYLSAENAGELGAALEAAVAMPPDIPAGRLSLKAIADGELQDVSIQVTDAATGEEVIFGRTYSSPDTNPRELPLADGTYAVEVHAIGIKGDTARSFEIEIIDSSTVTKEVDYSTGEVSIHVTRNGELSDAVYKVYAAGGSEAVASGRTYTSSTHNPATVRLSAGSYRVEVETVEIEGKPTHQFATALLEPRGRIELSHEFTSGALAVGAVMGSDLVDATVRVIDLESGKAVAGGRTYTSPNSNPKTYFLEPGRYRVEVKAVRLEGKPSRQLEATVEAGATIDLMAEFGQ
jgi:Ca-activated chloride channel family protein